MANEFSVAPLVLAMQHTSDEVKREVGGLIVGSAEWMKATLPMRYPQGPTGNLRRLIRVTQPRTLGSSFGVPVPVKQVRATAPHIHIFQEGTRERFDATRGNARRGRSPEHGRIFERTAVEARQRMVNEAERLLQRNREIV